METRIIKFRGKNVKGEWVTGDLLRNRGETFIAPDGIANPLATVDDFQVDPATVGQFTGLLDRNGREIYEGDVFGIPNGPNNKFYRVVKWVRDGFYLIDKDGYGGKLGPEITLNSQYVGVAEFLRQHNYSYEVIGSIHDTPELLSPKQL